LGLLRVVLCFVLQQARMKQLRFVILDLANLNCSDNHEDDEDAERFSSSAETLEALRDGTAECLRELMHYTALLESVQQHSLCLSLIVFTKDEPVQVLLKPQKFQWPLWQEALTSLAKLPIQASCTAMENTQPRRNEEEALALASHHIQQLKEKNPKLLQEYTLKVSYITLRCPSVSERLGDIIQLLSLEDVLVEFIYLSSPEQHKQQSEENLLTNNNLAELVLFLRSWPTTSITRAESGDQYALRKIFKSWITSNATIAELHFPKGRDAEETLFIKCELHSTMIDVELKCTNVCSCCRLPVESAVQCTRRKTLLSKLQTVQAWSLGDTLFRKNVTPGQSSTTVFSLLKRVDLVTLSESLFYGEPWIVSSASNFEEWERTNNLNSQQFVAVWQLLWKKRQALLLETKGFPDPTSPLTHLFILLPNLLTTNPSFMLRGIIAKEQYLPVAPNEFLSQIDPTEEVVNEMNCSLEKGGNRSKCAISTHWTTRYNFTNWYLI